MLRLLRPVASILLVLASTAFVPASAGAAPGQDGPLVVQETPAGVQLEYAGTVFHTTTEEVRDARLVEVAGSSVVIALWGQGPAGESRPYYAISLDGSTFATVRETSYELQLRRQRFDPLETTPDFSDSPFSSQVGIHIVQYVTQPLHVYNDQLRALGATVNSYLPYHAVLVGMAESTREQVQELPFVRWVGPYHPEYRLDEELLAGARAGLLDDARYVIRTHETGPTQKGLVAGVIRQIGGTIDLLEPTDFLLEATLTLEQLLVVTSLDEVQFIDPWGPPETDMDIAREFSGANHVELATGFTGQGVRGEVMDTGVRVTHRAFVDNGGVQIHGGNSSSQSHGTSVSGIVFGAGTYNQAARGTMPSIASGGQIVFAAYNAVSDRKAHTLQLTSPASSWQCVFQTNSWGSPTTTQYSNFSAQMDDIIFDADIIILQSQSNTGSQLSRPQAWAKNIVSVGGITHNNSLSDATHTISGASHGPAADGRVKPDLAHFYDNILTASSGCDTCTTSSFGGTSGATPITAGHFGIFHQLWHDGAFDNAPSGATVFESRPHFETAKAAMINTAVQWRQDAPSWIARERQGWGRVDVRNLFELRNRTFFVDREMIDNLETKTYQLTVPAGTEAFRATMVYRDLPGTTTSNLHRINDLSLRVVSPSGTEYWGNNGLNSGRWSTSGGSPNDRDTVENVFVSAPLPGAWTIQVIGHDINTDLPAYSSIPGNQADFSLWVTGVEMGCTGAAVVYCTSQVNNQLCLPLISASGSASASAGSGFLIEATGVLPEHSGLLFYSTSGSASMPFQNGTMCMLSPTKRTPVQVSSPAPIPCSSTFSLDFNALIASGVDPALVPGTTVYAQYWSRDPDDSFGSNFTNAVQFTICD